MSNSLTGDTKVIAMLCGNFDKDCQKKPLTQSEYNSLAIQLKKYKMYPEDLLKKSNIEDISMKAGIDKLRLEHLLKRGFEVGFTLEKWQRSGIWVISRSDPEYPQKYKKHLGMKSPPLLFGIGNRHLMEKGGLAIIGSRKIDEEGEKFTSKVAELCANNSMQIISGGAQGVDKISITSALKNDGYAIEILADNLLKKSLEKNTRNAISDGRLLLISSYSPGAHFTVSRAMSRNKYIYAMADYGLVVSAAYNEGGTWAGAKEEINRKISIPVFVRTGNNIPLGNSKLLELGAIPWPQLDKYEELKSHLNNIKRNRERESLFHAQGINNEKSFNDKKEISDMQMEKLNDTIYQLVLPIILKQLETPATTEFLLNSLDINKTQLNIWLKKAIKEKRVVKLSRPVRYQKAEANKLPSRQLI